MIKKICLLILLLGLISPLAQAKSKSHLKKVYNQIPQSYLIYNQTGQVIDSKNINKVWPIASITKLMTAIVFSENNTNPDCWATITEDDIDTFKHTHSRLPQHRPMHCNDLIWMMLIVSDNFAANALSRSLPEVSHEQFIDLMNRKALELGMVSTHFVDPSGLSSLNVSTAYDLTKIIAYLSQKPDLIKSTSYAEITFNESPNHTVALKNSNKLVREYGFHPMLSKTGHIQESGFNLVYVQKDNCPSIIGMVILGSPSSNARASFAEKYLQRICTN